jgi:hypothetical protein
MAVTWTIPSMDRDLKSGDNENIITTIHWRASDTAKDGNPGSSYGSVSVTLVGTPKAYADVTEADAIGWAKDALGADEVKNIEDNIADQMKPATTASGVSW